MSQSLTVLILSGCLATAGLAAESPTTFSGPSSSPDPSRRSFNEATVYFYSDRGQFEAANPLLPLEDFEEGNVPPGGITLCSDPYDSTTSDDCWSPGDILPGVSVGSSNSAGMLILGDGLFGIPTIVTGPDQFVAGGYLEFHADVTAVGFDVLNSAGGGVVDIRIFGPGGLIATSQVQAGIPGTFFGVRSLQPITRIEYRSPGSVDELIDNLSFGVPRPTVLIFMDRQDFDLANPGLPIETFEEGMVVPGATQGCDAPVNASSNDLCFGPGDILPGVSFRDDPGPDPNGMLLLGAGHNGNPSIALGSHTSIDATVIDLDPPVPAVGMDLQCHFAADTAIVELYGTGGVPLGAFEWACTNVGTFLGTSSISGFDIERIRLYSPAGQIEAIDDVAFGEPVPPMDVIVYDNRPAFDLHNPGLPIEDFEAGMVPPGGLANCTPPVDSSSNDACFAPGDILPGISLADAPGPDPGDIVILGAGFNNNPSITLNSNTSSDRLVVTFEPPVRAAGMELQCHMDPADVDVAVWGEGAVLLALFQSPCTNGGTFLGLRTTAPEYIESIQIMDPAANSASEGVDNVAFGPSAHIFADGFESGDTSAWSHHVP